MVSGFLLPMSAAVALADLPDLAIRQNLDRGVLLAVEEPLQLVDF